MEPFAAFANTKYLLRVIFGTVDGAVLLRRHHRVITEHLHKSLIFTIN
jgi:hypothetical protein